MKMKILNMLLCLSMLTLVYGCSNGTVNNNLKNMIENVKTIAEYDTNTDISQIQTISFGKDEDGDSIEWIILEKLDDKVFVLSKNLLFPYEFSYPDLDSNWESSTIRKYLNEEFINKVFSKNEQNSIIETDIASRTIDGNAIINEVSTKDKLFLLSVDEIENYLNTDQLRRAKRKNGIALEYWLRTQYKRTAYKQKWGENELNDYTVANVDDRGTIRTTSDTRAGYNAEYMLQIRPAMWIKY